MPNTENLNPPSQDDSRISHRGRPTNLDILQQLAHDLCYEPVDIATDPVAKTRLEAILREWLDSNDFRKQRTVIEYAFGKVPPSAKVKKKKGTIHFNWDQVDCQQNNRERTPPDDLQDELDISDNDDDDDPDL